MARRLNKRLLVYVLIFVGVPAVVLVYALLNNWFAPRDPTPYFESAKKCVEQGEWGQAWVAIRNAVKVGGAKNPDIMYLQAQIAMNQVPPAGNVAVQSYRAALAVKPDFEAAQRDLAELYLKSRYWKEAKGEIDRLIKLNPSFGKAYVWGAVVELALADGEPLQGRKVPFYEAAVARCQAGIEKAPDQIELYRLLAAAYERLGQTGKVDATCDQAIANNPKSPDAYTMKAQRLMALDKSDEAVAILKKALQVAGESPSIYLALASTALQMRRPEQAREYLTKAISLDPKNEASYLRLAGLYRAEGDRKKELEVMTQGLAQVPNSMVLKLEQTELYLDTGNLKQGDQQIEEMAKAFPDTSGVNYLRGKRAIMSGQIRQAISYLEKAREKQAPPKVRLMLARAYMLGDELGAAQRELEALTGEFPNATDAWRSMAEVQFRLHDFDRAGLSARRVLEVNADDTPTRMLLARTLVQRQRLGEALKEAQTAADRDKDNAEPLLLESEIQLAMDRKAEAEAALKRAVDVSKNSTRVFQRYVRFLKDTNQQDKLQKVMEGAKKVLSEDDYVILLGDPAELEKQLKAKADKEGAPLADLINLARLYQVTGRTDPAKELLRKVLAKAEPTAAEWRAAWGQLFMLELATEAYAKAADLIGQLRKVEPEAPELKFADPLLAMSQEKLPQAEEMLRAVAQENKSLSQAQFLLGQVLVRERKYEEAIDAFGKALELRPQLTPARLMRARLYLDRGNLQAVLAETAEAIKFDSRLIPAWEMRAIAYAGLGDWKAAAGAREEIAKILPDNVNNLIALARMHLQQHEPAKAEEVYTRALKLAPDNALLVSSVADFYAETNRAKQGETIIDDFVSRHKDQAAAYVLRGEFTAKAAGPKESEKYYRKAAELAPEDPSPIVFLGDQYSRAGDWGAAAAAYLEAAKRSSKDLTAKRRLADVYMLQGKLAEAKTLVDSVMQADSKDTSALVVAGRVASRQGRADDARRYFEAALAIDPNYGEAKVRLAELYAGPDPLKALEILTGVDPSDPSFEKAMLLRADINSRRVLLREAIMDLRRLLDFRPTSTMGRLALASKYMAVREPVKAQEIYTQLSKEHLDQDASLLIALGDSLQYQQRYADALPKYEKARALKPDASDALVGEARCLMALNRTDDAIARIRRVMDIDPQAVWPRIALSAVYQRAGDMKKAYDVLRTGLIRNETWEAGYVLLANLLLTANQNEEGRQVLLTGLSKLPKSIPIRGSLAMIDVTAGRPEAAKRTLDPLAVEFKELYGGGLVPEKLDKLRPYILPIRIYSLALYHLGQPEESVKWGMIVWSIEPTDVANANNMAWVLGTEFKDYPKALDMIDQALRLVPNHPQMLDTRGWILFLTNRYDDAADCFAASIKNGDNAEAHYHLGCLYQARERWEDAQTEFQKALDMGLSTPKDKVDCQKRLAEVKTKKQ